MIQEHGLTIRDLQRIFTRPGETTWDEFLVRKDRSPLHAYTRSDPCGTAEVVADFLYLTRDDLHGIAADGEYQMIDAVLRDSLALGYCNFNEAFDLEKGVPSPGLEFLPVDLNMNGSIEPREAICSDLDGFQNSICINTYPFKFSRNLYLVALSKPQDVLAQAFLYFCLTDGQFFVKKLGYSEIPSSLIEYHLYLLNDW